MPNDQANVPESVSKLLANFGEHFRIGHFDIAKYDALIHNADRVVKQLLATVAALQAQIRQSSADAETLAKVREIVNFDGSFLRHCMEHYMPGPWWASQMKNVIDKLDTLHALLAEPVAGQTLPSAGDGGKGGE